MIVVACRPAHRYTHRPPISGVIDVDFENSLCEGQGEGGFENFCTEGVVFLGEGAVHADAFPGHLVDSDTVWIGSEAGFAEGIVSSRVLERRCVMNQRYFMDARGWPDLPRRLRYLEGRRIWR